MTMTGKADQRAAECIEFASRHRWAKYFCVGAVSVIYGTEYLRRRVVSACDKIHAAMTAPFRPLYKRAVSLLGSLALAGMVFPAEVLAYEESEEEFVARPLSVSNPVVLPEPRGNNFDPAASPNVLDALREAEKNYTVTGSGLAEENDSYSVDVDAKKLGSDVIASFSKNEKKLDSIVFAFSGYNIPTDDLYIVPYDITLYSAENKKLSLKRGMSADVTMPVPVEMTGHLNDIQAIRLENDNTITVLKSEVIPSDQGYVISFTTEHFSTFALVSYNSGINTENISASAGMTASGMNVSLSVSFSGSVIGEDKNNSRSRKHTRKIYRIKSIRNENDILL
ncbi:MAG: hypothetical protein ACI4KF_09180 [Huintestinicola sp.]